MKFKQFLNEQEELELCEGVKEDIISILNNMNTEEISEFGEFLDNSLESDAEYFDEDTYTKEEVIEILGTLTSDDLDYAYYMIQDEDENHIENKITPDTSAELVQEKVSRKMAPKNRNKAKKRFTLTKSELRRGKSVRKKENRKNKVQKKKYKMKNKVNMKRYAANYTKDVAAGKHKKKIRR